ncbi:hypothetical protein [Morganella psychrotolerans]|uniref:Uncharacterized protein n=1 Tax=Morganella psychrotolerans TaxID=368603 RepID=A0A1B8H4B2_9GAMM|nr:hypothetical protein [Morganella psychrotolerans]OBU03917.1 hypothetical protein AYY17_10215 [Morganella psychrotolerans]
MKLTNILPSAHKASPENKCLKNMSELPYINKLLQKLDSLKNTNVKFEGQYVNFRSDIVKLSKNVLSLHYNAELTDLGIKDKPEQIKNEPAKTTLNERAKEWYQQERNTIPVAIIKREIDHVCAEKKIGLTSEEINRIVDIVNEKHIQNNMLAKDGATYSTMFSLKLDGELSKKNK